MSYLSDMREVLPPASGDGKKLTRKSSLPIDLSVVTSPVHRLEPDATAKPIAHIRVLP